MSTERRVRKAVIPVAGLGTRFLPATKAIPKEMLPVVDKPAIQYVVEEAVRAQVGNIVMVTGRNKGALEDHFDRHWELEQALEKKGDELRLRRVQKSNEMGAPHFVRQGEPKGLGHAVLCGRAHVGDEPFAVLLGDDLIGADEHLLEQMIATQEQRGGSVVALMEVPQDQVNMYGCAAIDGEPDENGVVRVTGLVEKPDPADAPSNLAIIGRYVLDPSIFDVLEELPPGRGNEIQLTDALEERATAEGEGSGVWGVVFRGNRYDTGDRLDYLKAMVRLARRHGEFGDEFDQWLREYVQSLDAPAQG
ncbi:UTP--glucose-1-phosphate uridylyltransferase GalU [Kytococcus sp. Marseille-QA3725]